MAYKVRPEGGLEYTVALDDGDIKTSSMGVKKTKLHLSDFVISKEDCMASNILYVSAKEECYVWLKEKGCVKPKKKTFKRRKSIF